VAGACHAAWVIAQLQRAAGRSRITAD